MLGRVSAIRSSSRFSPLSMPLRAKEVRCEELHTQATPSLQTGRSRHSEIFARSTPSTRRGGGGGCSRKRAPPRARVGPLVYGPYCQPSPAASPGSENLDGRGTGRFSGESFARHPTTAASSQPFKAWRGHSVLTEIPSSPAACALLPESRCRMLHDGSNTSRHYHPP